jgi:hypothetical protein
VATLNQNNRKKERLKKQQDKLTAGDSFLMSIGFIAGVLMNYNARVEICSASFPLHDLSVV